MRRRAFLFFAAFVVYNLNLRPIPAGDTAPAALMPFAIAGDHTMTFDRYASWYRQSQHMSPNWFRRLGDGHYYSSYPVALPLLLTPFYAPVVVPLDVQHMPVDQVVLLARICEKVSASLVAAVSVAAFLALAEKLTNRRAALWLTVVYALGSETWAISSQALWQHGASELAVILGLLCLVRASEQPGRTLPAVSAGLCAGLAVAVRLSNVIFLLVTGGYVLLSRWDRARKAAFSAAAMVFPAATLAYNLVLFAGPSGGYTGARLYNGNLLRGVSGLLFSPSRGLLVFSPIFILSVLGVFLWLRGRRPPRPEIYWICLLVAALEIPAIGQLRVWHGGFSYGPRLLTDIVPCLVILLIPVMDLVERSLPWRMAFGGLLLLSISVQAIGAFCYPNGHWDALPVSVDRHRERIWDWRDNQIFRSAAAGPVLDPYYLAWGFLTGHGSAGAKTLEERGIKLW